MQENDEQFSGDELGESGDEKSESIPEEEKFSGSELDDSGDEKGELIPEGEEFTGEELDEEEHEEGGDEGGESIPEEESTPSTERKYRGKRWLSLYIALGLCILLGVGYLLMKGQIFFISSNQNKETPQNKRLAIPKDQLLLFHSLIIPFHENKNFTYISFNIYFNVPNKELRREMNEKENQLRGIIYDMLTGEINRVKEVPPLGTLKELILRGVNTALSTGKVDEIYITEFLAV